jgi:hypothetical protein
MCFHFGLSVGEESELRISRRYDQSRMWHIGRFGWVAILAGATLTGQPAGSLFDRYRGTLDRCRFLVNESRMREAEGTCRQAVKLSGQLPSAAKRERIAAGSLAAQIYLDLGLPEDALRFAGPASTLAQTGLPATDILRGVTRYQVARCDEGLSKLESAEQNSQSALRDLNAAVLHASGASQRNASEAALRDAAQSYSQLLSAEGKSDQASAIAKQFAAVQPPARKP